MDRSEGKKRELITRKFSFLDSSCMKAKKWKNKEGMGGLKDKQRLGNWRKSIWASDVHF